MFQPVFPMHATEQRALLSILVHAAMSDGHKADSERQFIRDLSQQLDGTAGAQHLAQAVQDALLKRVSLTDAVQSLADASQRQLAYEWSVAVCDADGVASPAEQAFLDRLRGLLGLAGEAAVAVQASEAQTHALSSAYAAGPAPEAPPVAPAGGPSVDQAALDKMVLNYAILNGALELLPQSWASMAIIPLQIRMVYRIGAAHGVALDQGHIREFIATAGVGLTSQYLEQFGRKLLGGLIGKAGGRMLGGLAGQATGMAFSFATTYALGQLARRYYAGGRVMSTELLRQTYQGLLGPAKDMQQRHLPEIQNRARTLDAAEVMRLVRA
jgi:uncharacterized protein (DUF697 family)/tellurite resistance protein